MKPYRGLLHGVLVFSIAGVISKVLSAGYRIPLQNIAGDQGLYIYQQVYPFLSLAWLLSIYGFPAAISSLIAKQINSNDSSAQGLYTAVFLYLYAFGGALFFILYSSSEHLARWMGDPELAEPLRMASYVYLAFPLTSLFRGIQQASYHMSAAAWSQILEQFVRVSGIMFATVMFLEKRSLYELGAGAAFASTVAALTAALFLLWKSREVFTSVNVSRKIFTNVFQYLNVWKTLLVTGFVFSLNYMILLLFQLVDVFTMIPALQEYGLTLEEAKKEKGVFDRGQPLVQFGIVFGSSLSLAMIPVFQNKRTEVVTDDIKSVFKLTFLFSFGAAAGLITIFPAVNVLLYKTNEGTGALQLFSLLIFLLSLTMSLSVILQKFGYVKRQIIWFFGAMVAKGILNIWLIPVAGITGAALASVVSTAVLLWIFLVILKQHVSISIVKIIPWRKAGFALLMMIAVVYGITSGAVNLFTIEERIEFLWVVLTSCMTGALLYLGLLLKLNTFTEEELREVPYRDKIFRILGVKSR
ncbi:PST family polysaccharide transporter [Melghiribacillus thermohalophilus]|uniref:PST family polysaccharide transporter n=1 Tax=Melghiribacillus thermohalophilus TaxID=1324956 RepID=A0A4R3MW93_9BACI|nr:polysaccharide biosynthesis protein [Melghiribacillus thermohalophilus]TCT18164.1 PST family polysaccharide transporter [Melghiribacillus thermohalophilus]